MGRRDELISCGTRLFSEKGFHQTSVQEIAQTVHISKGAFYNFFESKESLLIEILKEHYENMIKQANAMSHLNGVTKKEAFIKKLSMELEQRLSNREFFTVLFKDFPPNKNEQVVQMMKRLKSSMSELHKDTFLETYGDEIKPFITDIVIMFEGVLKEYIISVMLKKNGKQVDIERLARFIVLSFDSIIQSLPSMEPVLTENQSASYVSNVKKRIKNCILLIEEKIKNLSVDTLTKNKLLDSLYLLKLELKKEEKQSFLVEALLVYLKQEKELTDEIQHFERLYKRFEMMNGKGIDVWQ
ncbi:TetR/AcrR family transcriptional regulator [Oceanobacillus senegalensis]|uniref:TetR/AcrR family transcriptional regulator n=1 Tax=Oceanobacillus senegalensis TaxID=1936063 RepID=UPI000A3125F2|nr:TetR/AcrR family transcriptional regulator [Oceanobacillus senegalensis]